MADRRGIDPPFVAPGPTGVAIRDRLKGLSPADEEVLGHLGQHLGSLASRDLKVRCAAGLDHDSDQWAARKRALTAASSSRWAGSITKATHDQWALARRGQLADIQNLEAGAATIAHRLSLPVGEEGGKGTPGGYRSPREWFAKTRRLAVLEDRLERGRADRAAGRVRVVRGGKRLVKIRHNLDQAKLTEAQWQRRWEASRWFLAADGESGKRYGNETIRVTPGGEVSIKLPAPLARLANARHGRYVLAAKVRFDHRRGQWRDAVEANRAVAYRIHYDTERACWYLTASWTFPPVRTIPLAAVLAVGVIGVDTNADHLAAWRLDRHGNPMGTPRRFGYELSGAADHRDAQVRHALTRLLHWARACGVNGIAIEDLNFTAETTREKHGRRKRFRQLISGMPTGRLRARLVSMADRANITIIAVDPAYTSKWGSSTGKSPSQPRTAPPLATTPQPWRSAGAPKATRSGDGRHRPRTTRAIVRGIGPSRPDRAPLGVRNPAPAFPDHGHDPCRPDAARTWETRTPKTVRGVRLSMSSGTRTHPRSDFRNGWRDILG